ncbi:MAG: hypothetical protein AAF697_00410 [Pseudomonadota bacterium]
MSSDTEHSLGYYVSRIAIGAFVILAAPAVLFALTVSSPTNLSRVCTTTDGEVFRLVAFGEEEDPWTLESATLLDAGRNAAFVQARVDNPDLPRADDSVRVERPRESVAECGEPFVLDFAARDLDPASEEFAAIHAE